MRIKSLCAIFVYFLLYSLSIPLNAYAQVAPEFEGIPLLSINEFGVFRVPTEITSEEQATRKVLITKKDNKFYWTSRENRELNKIEAANFITYLALDGSGYIRIGNEEWKSKMRMKYPKYNFDYMEHMVIGLGSLSYFGITLK